MTPTLGNIIDLLLGKSSPTASDVHVDRPMDDEEKKRRKTEATSDGKIVKVSEEERMVYGWASVLVRKGTEVVDLQGDVIDPAEMARAATSFMKSARLAKAMHQGDGIGQVVHSMPITKEICGALGIECDQEGWIVGVHVSSDDVWKRVVSGELRAFSIGGRGQRTEEDEK